MSTISILMAALAAQAAVLAGTLTLVVRLRARVERLQARAPSDSSVIELTALVAEAETLGDALCRRIADQIELFESIVEASRMPVADAAAVADPATTAPKAARATPSTAGRSAAPRKKAITAAVSGSKARRPVEAIMAPSAASDPAGDILIARETGMDPLGVAIQRALRRGATA